MDNERMNSDFDEQYKKHLKNLPEEKPSVKDWELLRGNLQKEGLIKNNSNGRKYFLLFLLAAIVAGGISIPLLLNRYSIDLSFISSTGDSGEQSKITVKHAKEKTAAGITSDKETPQTGKHILQEANAEPEVKEADIPETNLNSGVQVLAQRQAKKVPESAIGEREEDKTKKNISRGGNENSKGEETPSKGESEMESGKLQPASQAEANSNREASVDSGIAESATAPSGNNSVENSDTDSAVIAEPVKDAKSDSAQAAAQAPKDTTQEKSGFSPKPWIGIYTSWDFTGYHLKENNNVTAGEAGAALNSSDIGGENSLAQYTLGIMGGLRVSKKFALEAGAFFSQKRKLRALISSPAGADAQGNESFSDFVYNYNARYIEAYGRIKYYFLEKKHSCYAGIGAAGSFNFPSSKTDKGYFERITFSETSAPQTDIVTLESSSAGFSIVVSAGMEVILSQRWNFFVEPSYKHALTSVTRHPYYDKIPVEHFWRTFSLGTGLMYKF